jgi:hypothetical protein
MMILSRGFKKVVSDDDKWSTESSCEVNRHHGGQLVAVVNVEGEILKNER